MIEQMRHAPRVLLLVGLYASSACSRVEPGKASSSGSETAAAAAVSQTAESRATAERDAIRDLMVGDLTLPEAIRHAGGKLTLDARPNPDYFRVPNLESLTRKSQVVVVARQSGPPRVQLSDNARSVVTHYDMVVETVARQDGKVPPTLTVEVPGGQLKLDEGFVEVVNGPTFTSGNKYILFLQDKEHGKPRAPAKEIFVVTGFHYEGILRIDGSSTVRTSETSASRLAEQYDRRDVRSLLTAVRATKRASS
jgi:hypothetical protein